MELEISDIEADEARDGWTVVAPIGEIDVTSAPTLRDALIDLIADGRRQVVVDLESVDFIDSTGLGVLVGAARRARTTDDADDAAGDVRVVCTNSRILKVFAATGLDQTFCVGDDVDAVIAAPSKG